jgi:hypothetical protein
VVFWNIFFQVLVRRIKIDLATLGGKQQNGQSLGYAKTWQRHHYYYYLKFASKTFRRLL